METARGTLPYSTFADQQKLVDRLRQLDQLDVHTYIRSKDASVKPSDIKVEARLKSGQVVSISIAADGTFTIPAMPALAQENPLFVSNQPKGTMELDFRVGIKPPALAAQHYVDLMRGLAQIDDAMKIPGVPPAPKFRGLLFGFREGTHTLTLHTTKGDRVTKSETREQLHKDHKEASIPGAATMFIYVPLDEDLMRENPRATFDEVPVAVVPAP